MARKSHSQPFDLPPLELECMKTLWASGEGTVQEIRDWLFPHRPLAYTTVMTVMGRLARKGVVEREKRGRAHLYRARVGEESVRERAIVRLTENFFRGSRAELRRYLEGGGTRSVRLADAGRLRPPRGLDRGPGARANLDPEGNIDPTLL
jgi:BlaI family transcriptional regulator, penicillinase repressor